jgi:predicted transcriptional regulator
VQAVHAVTLARAGWSATEINNHLGLTGRGWVYRTLRHAGVSPKALGRRAATTPEQRAAAVALYEAGHTYKDIAEATGLSHANVANVLRAAHKRGDLPEYGRRLQRTAS